MKKRYKIISKTRFFLFIITVSAITTMLIMSILSINEVYGSNHSGDYKEIEIINGDTLWMLALDYMPEEYDVRKMLYEIKMLNNMETSNVYPGDIIKIPITRR